MIPLTDPGAQQFSYPRHLVFASLSQDSRCVLPRPTPYMGTGDLNSGLYAITESTLLAELSPRCPAQVVFSNTIPLTCRVSWMLCLCWLS